MIELDVSIEHPGWESLGDVDALTLRAISAAFDVTGGPPQKPVSVSLLFADDMAIKELNSDWRNQAKPTNVLSFPAVQPPGFPGPELLGDIALSYETCTREAEQEGKTLIDHTTHLIIHGALHLLGYDHIEEEDATEMEALEVAALALLGIDDPYRDTEISS